MNLHRVQAAQLHRGAAGTMIYDTRHVWYDYGNSSTIYVFGSMACGQGAPSKAQQHVSMTMATLRMCQQRRIIIFFTLHECFMQLASLCTSSLVCIVNIGKTLKLWNKLTAIQLCQRGHAVRQTSSWL